MSGPDLFSVYHHVSAAEAASGNSGDFSLSGVDLGILEVNVSVVTGSIQFILETKDPDGNYLPIYTGSVISAAAPLITGFGPGTPNNIPFTDIGRLRWVIVTGPVTFTATVHGRELPAVGGAG